MNNYIKVYNWMQPLPLAEQMVLAFIGGFGYKGCFLNNADIALRTGLSPRSVSKAVSHFYNMGLITLRNIDSRTRVLTMAADAEMRCNRLATDKATPIAQAQQDAPSTIADCATHATQIMPPTIAEYATTASQNVPPTIAECATLSYNIKETIKQPTKGNIKARQEENFEKNSAVKIEQCPVVGEVMNGEEHEDGTDEYVAMMEAWQQHWQEIKGVGYTPTAWTHNDIASLLAAFRLCQSNGDAIEVQAVVVVLRTFYTVADNWQRSRWDVKLIVNQFNQLYAKAYNYVNHTATTNTPTHTTTTSFNIDW